MFSRYKLALLVLAGLGTLAACVSQGGSETSQPAPTITNQSVAPSTIPPTELRAAEFLSDAELKALLPSTPVTTAPPGVVYASIVERQEFRVDCLREAGFAAEFDPEDNSVSVNVPEEQQDAYWEASAWCRGQEFAEFGIGNDEDFTKTFRAFLYVRQCMVENGYEVSRPPSLEVFVESHGSAWHPYDAAVADPSFTMEQLQELEQLCPQDLGYLYQVLDFGP